MAFANLSKFEETMTNLAAYLIAAPQRHDRHIYSMSEASEPEGRSSIKTRVTQHFSAALLAYGFPTSEPEISRTSLWFGTPFPDTEIQTIDSIEMTKLEGLLNLAPYHATVEPRLRQLIAQRNAHYFEIDRTQAQGPPTQVFDTLWALKLIIMAREKGILNGLLSTGEIQAYLDHIVKVVSEDKDLALVLRLQYDLNGKLSLEQEQLLTQIIDQGQKYQGTWGHTQAERWQQVKHIVDAMQDQQITPALLRGYARPFREVILNTCYVIENLAPLAESHPQLADPIERSMQLWWRQFCGPKAPSILSSLFPDEYDFLMVLCRTLVTVREYIGEPLGARCWLPSLRETSAKFHVNAWPEQVSIDQALRRWIGIEIGKPSQLKLGLSGANVIRIRPSMYNPSDALQTDLLRESLIVKYGPSEEIDAERQNYNSLPEALRRFFVSIPDASYVDSDNRAFVIMQDLSEHFTLYEIFDRLLKSNKPSLPRLLTRFLMDMHQAGNSNTGQPVLSKSHHLRDIYLLPMMGYMDTLLHFLDTMHSRELLPKDFVERIIPLDETLHVLMGGIMQQHRIISQFPLACMHGDLHTRNIMIYKPDRVKQRTTGAEIEFKLIDLESLRTDGDAAHDAAQLLIDLTLVMADQQHIVSRPILDRLEALGTEIRRAYVNFATQHEDRHFEARLALAQARSLLRIAKSHAKRGHQAIRSREDQEAIDRAANALGLAETACSFLKNVRDYMAKL